MLGLVKRFVLQTACWKRCRVRSELGYGYACVPGLFFMGKFVMDAIKITLAPLEPDDREQFISDNQEAFRFGAMEEFGCRDAHMESPGEIISLARFDEQRAVRPPRHTGTPSDRRHVARVSVEMPVLSDSAYFGAQAAPAFASQ